MKFLTLLALFGVVTRIQAQQPPMKARVNTELLKKIFHSRDQVILDLFQNQSLEITSMDFDEKDKVEKLDDVAPNTAITDLVASLKPKTGAQDDFDFDLHIEEKYLGAESANLMFQGSGKYDGKDFTFSGPITLLKYHYALGQKFNEEMNYQSNVFQEQPFVLDIDSKAVTFEGAELSESDKDFVAKKFSNKLKHMKSEIQAAKEDKIPQFPMDIAVPYVLIFYATQFAEQLKFQDKYLEFGFSATHLGLLSAKEQKLLKPITGEFDRETNKDGQDAFVQMNIDDNFFNSITSNFVSIEKMFSMRELLKGNIKAKPVLEMLTTSTVGAVLPVFVEEFGHGKKIDLVGSPSHSFFLDGIPGSKMTGIYMDKNGNWKFQINVAFQLNVERLPGMWEPVRNIYMTVVAKLKATMTDEDDKQIIFLPKNVEVTELKVMKEDEVMDMEQMMIQSMLNVQLQQGKKMFKEIPGKVSTLIERLNFPEIQCFGFNIADLDMSYKKSQVQFSVYYKETENADKAICDKFKEELKKSPQKILEQIKGGEDSAIAKGMKAYNDVTDKAKKVTEEGTVNPAKTKKQREAEETRHEEL